MSAPNLFTSSLGALERAVLDRRTELLAFWEKSSSADRIFALERLVRDEALRPHDEDVVLAIHDQVREAWAGARAAKIAGAVLAQKRHELDLAVLERRLTALLAERGLFDALFMASEHYLRVVPRSPAELSFRELVRRRDELRRAAVNILPPTVSTGEAA
jgi:hypothetical protein